MNRKALIIGINNYDNINDLSNARNDAEDIDKILIELGFSTKLIINLDRNELYKAIINSKKDKTDVNLIYYAGHGIQSNGINYLLPKDSNPQSEEEIPIYGIELNQLIDETEFILNQINIIIIDSCRNNPFQRSFYRDLSIGLAPVIAPSGCVIAFSTSPGRTASDGKGKNGLYTESLLQTLKNKDLSLNQIFQETRKNVLEKSSFKQIPWETTSLIGDFYFFTPKSDSDIRILEINKIVNSIEGNSYKYLSKDSFIESTEGGELRIYDDDNKIVKIENSVFGEMYKNLESLYFNKNTPIYFKRVTYKYNTHIVESNFDMDKAQITTEQYYLESNEIFYFKKEDNNDNKEINEDSLFKFVNEHIKKLIDNGTATTTNKRYK